MKTCSFHTEMDRPPDRPSDPDPRPTVHSLTRAKPGATFAVTTKLFIRRAVQLVTNEKLMKTVKNMASVRNALAFSRNLRKISAREGGDKYA